MENNPVGEAVRTFSTVAPGVRVMARASADWEGEVFGKL